MPRVAELLDRESQTVDLEHGDFERLLRRRERKQRNRRLRAGAVALVVTLSTVAIFLRSFAAGPIPADEPVPPAPMALGALAYPVDGDIYVGDWDGANPVRIANGRPGGGRRLRLVRLLGGGADVVPDGRYLAYRGEVCDAIPTVWISDSEGNIVTSFRGEGWLISWSPDSTRVAVWVRWGKTIGVYGLDGVRQTLLTLPPGLMGAGDYDPVWSPDGASLLVPHGVEVPLDGRTPHQLPADDPRTGVISPDGSRVAFDNRDGSLIVAAADGSGARELIQAWVDSIVWSPTGDRIAFSYRTFNGEYATELRVIDLASGVVTPLAGMGGTDSTWALEFSPDGDKILFSRADRSARGDLALDRQRRRLRPPSSRPWDLRGRLASDPSDALRRSGDDSAHESADTASFHKMFDEGPA